MLTCLLTCEICAGRKRFIVYEEELAEVQPRRSLARGAGGVPRTAGRIPEPAEISHLIRSRGRATRFSALQFRIIPVSCAG